MQNRNARRMNFHCRVSERSGGTAAESLTSHIRILSWIPINFHYRYRPWGRNELILYPLPPCANSMHAGMLSWEIIFCVSTCRACIRTHVVNFNSSHGAQIAKEIIGAESGVSTDSRKSAKSAQKHAVCAKSGPKFGLCGSNWNSQHSCEYRWIFLRNSFEISSTMYSHLCPPSFWTQTSANT